MKEKTFNKPLKEEEFKAYDEWAAWCNTNGYRILDDKEEYYYCEKIPDTAAEDRIIFLKRELSRTDYQAIKYAEGYLTEEEYAETKTQRQAWRDEINALEAQAKEA